MGGVELDQCQLVITTFSFHWVAGSNDCAVRIGVDADVDRPTDRAFWGWAGPNVEGSRSSQMLPVPADGGGPNVLCSSPAAIEKCMGRICMVGSFGLTVGL